MSLPTVFTVPTEEKKFLHSFSRCAATLLIPCFSELCLDLFIWLRKKKSIEVKSGDIGGYSIGSQMNL